MTTRTFQDKAYKKYNQKGINLFKEYLLRKGFQVLEKPEDFDVDLLAYSNGKEYRFEIELSNKYNLTSFDNEVHFFQRKARMKNFYYVKIHVPTKTFFAPYCDEVFQNCFLKKIYYEDKYRKGDEVVYAVPMERLKLLMLND